MSRATGTGFRETGNKRRSLARVWVLATVAVLAWSPLRGAQEGTEALQETGVDMSLVPTPTLENLEDGVRSQLTELRQAVEEQVVEGRADPGELGASLGQLGSLYLLYDYIDAADACLLIAQRLDPEEFRWPYYLGALYTLEGEVEKAQAALAVALVIDPRDLPARVRQGNLDLEEGELADAEANFRQALEADPPSSAARFGLGRVAFARGEYAAAIPHFEAALEGQPEGSVAHYFLGMSLRHIGDLEKARHHLGLSEHEPVLFHDPLIDQLQASNVSREAFFSLGVDAMRRGEPERALEAFQRALAAQPDDPETHYNLGMAYVEMGEQEQAEASIRKATELRPDYRDANFNLAVLLARRGEHREAARYFERAAQIDSEDLRAQVRWADALSRIGEEKLAIEKLEQVLEVDPAMVSARLSLAAVQAEVGELEAAEQNLSSILALAPGAVKERSEAHYRLATLDPGWPRDEVIDHLRSAVELDPGFAEAHLALAVQLGRERDYSGAALSYSRALELGPGDSQTHFGHAMALILGGLYQQARQALEQSLNLQPESVPLRHLLARLLATCPDPEVRDGERSLELSQRIVQEELTLDHAETLAMAYAELGRFADAIRWQRQLVSQEQKMRGTVAPERLKRLEVYEQGEPVRAPWLENSTP